MSNFRLVRAHRGKENTVVLWGKDEDGRKLPFTAEDFRPYFYCLAEEAVEDVAIVGTEFGYTSIYGDNLRKVIVSNPSEVPRLRDKFTRHFEADVPYARRYIIDRMITSGFNENLVPCELPDIPLSVWSLDIECFSGDKMPNPDTDTITCLSITDGQEMVSAILDDVDYLGKDGILHFDTEKKLLMFVSKLLEEESPDILLGWNLPFDVEYIEKRCAKRGLKFSLDGTCQFDLLPAYRILYRRKSYRLKDIALEEGLTDKLEEKCNYTKLWEEEKPALLERNRNHCRWVWEIDKKHKIVEYYESLRSMAGLEDFDNVIYNSVLIDTMILRRTFAVLPSKKKREHETYEGALIMKPEEGVFDNIAIFDLKAFYPNILLSEQLDPVILNAFQGEKLGKVDWEGYKTFAKGYISENKPTLILGLVEEVMKERYRLQEGGHLEKLMPIKAVLNSVYGTLAHSNFRLYTPQIPERITEVARTTISSLRDEVNGWNYKVIYLDTDSIMFSIPKDQLSIMEAKLNDTLKKYGDYTIKLEGFYPKMLFTGTKKKYVGISEDGKLHIIGFEPRRSDASNFTKELQVEVMRMMLTGKIGEIIPYLRNKVDTIPQCSLKDLAITKTLSKDLDKYDKQEQNYILAAKQAKLDLTQGDAVNIIPATNYPFKVAVYRDESDLPKKVIVDFKKIVDSQIRAKVEDLLPIVNLSWGEVIGQKRLL